MQHTSKPVYAPILLFKFLFPYLFLAALGPRCCVRAFPSCSDPGLLSSCDAQASPVVAFLLAEHSL